MATIGATNSATLSLQQSLVLGRVEQAKRQAEVAERQAQDLRQQADQAEQDAQASRENYRQTRAQAARAEPATYSLRQGANRSEVPEKTQDFLVRMYSAASDKFAASGNPLKSDPEAATSKNALGQTTGRILSVSA